MIENQVTRFELKTSPFNEYIRRCITNGKTPSFYLRKFNSLKEMMPKENKIHLSRLLEQSILEQQRTLDSIMHRAVDYRELELSWNSEKEFFIYIDYASHFHLSEDCESLFVKCALVHGHEQVATRESLRIDVDKFDRNNLSVYFNEPIHFNCLIKNLHRCTKIYLCLSYLSRKKKEIFSLGVICLNLFDFNGFLINGKRTLFLWPIEDSKENFLSICNSHILSGSNTNKNFIKLIVEFHNGDNSTRIAFPNKSQIRKFVSRISNKSNDECFDYSEAIENDNNQLETIIKKDSLAELTEQEKFILWRRRYDCLNYPSSLPKLLLAVKWSDQNQLIEMYKLLKMWPDIKPIVAMELLNSLYADIKVRNFAVKCLDKYMKNEEIQQYLLQFIQALKNETYYDNALCKFLLCRSFQSIRLGFDFFWNLKSEMTNLKCKFRFGLILEAYCRVIDSNLNVLVRQVEIVNKLSALAQMIKNDPDNLSMISGRFLQNQLSITSIKSVLSNFTSPVSKSNIHGTIEPNECKILSSAKRPLFLTWLNSHRYADLYENKFQLIFKHGDDLRQDMLTLQILKIINMIWKKEGLDFKMLIYDCFSTGFKIGFIEVIKNSLTVFKIQTDSGKMGKYQIDTSQLFKWICMNNQNPNQLNAAIDNFTKSCAGYCVATYVLGIGDRHPDNIMVNKNGKLFHIDFGHFLGHFKKKMGFKRERVPFVLTEDFTRVIARGHHNPIETNEFQNFRLLCEKAYMILRRYSNLIITLFSMMLSSGMPELQSMDDLIFLRKKLAIDETEESALRIFREQFAESHKYSYTTKLDWFFHSLNKTNRI